ncbi:MAG: efflux RND transporter periplasmic adaptor subunit [Verrucomicrobiota bacterium]|nr:efflux RND transporter periplasmic adaptor subunit [Verrucomicrobiota bacterium]
MRRFPILLLSLLACAALCPVLGAETKPATAVQVVQPRRGEIIRYVTLPGTIRANQQATLYAKVGGYLKEIRVDKGDTVKEDELLAEIEVPERIAELKRYQADAKVAEIELQRLTEAQKKAPDLVLPQMLDKARAALEVANASMEGIRTLLDFAKITAPFAGVVTARFVDVGAFVPAATGGSTPQGGALLTVMDFSVVRAQTGVPEMEVPFVRQGQPAKVSLEELPGRAFEGKVTRFSHALDEVTRTMLVEIDLPNEDRELRPGMYAIIKLGVEQHADALLIPAEALVMEKTAAFVFKFVDGKAKKTPVTLGFNDGANVELLKGVEPAEQIIVAGKLTLADGQAVQIAPAK